MIRARRRTTPTVLFVGAALAVLLAGCGDQGTSTADIGETSAVSATSAASAPSPAAAQDDAATSDQETPEASSDAGRIEDLATAALTPEALPAPEQGFAWAEHRSTTAPRASGKLFDPCQPTTYPADEERTEVRTADLRVEEPGGAAPETATVRQNLARYPSTAVADEAFADFRRMAEDCAVGGDMTTEVVHEADGRLLLQTTPELGLFTSYAVVAQRGDVVTVVAYVPGEVRDADDDASAVADAVTAALDAAT